MLQAVQYCKCGTALKNIIVFLRTSENSTIAESRLVCKNCLEPVEIDLRKWGIKDESK